MAFFVRATAVVSFFAVFIANVHGNTSCDTCECPLSNVGLINDLINARLNPAVTAKVEETIATIEEIMNATLDQDISTINAAISAFDATADERIAMTSVTADTQRLDVKTITDRHLNQVEPGNTLFIVNLIATGY